MTLGSSFAQTDQEGVIYVRARDKKLKKSTESTAMGCSVLKYSYMPCSRFLKIGAFGAATVDVGELAQFAGELVEGGHLHGSAGTMFHLGKDGRGREPDAVG